MTTAIRCSIIPFLCVFAVLEASGAAAAKPAKKQPVARAAAAAPAKGKPAQPVPVAATTLRQAADEIARRHGLRIAIDDAVPADVSAPAVAAGTLSAPLLEATLRGLFAGSEVVFHYGPDRANGGERLKAVSVFSLAQGPLNMAANPGPRRRPAVESPGPAVHTAAPVRPSSVASAQVQSPPGRGFQDGDENERLQALHVDLASTSEPDLESLRRLVQEDASEAVRMLALDAYLTHPAVSEDEGRAMLDRVSGDSQQMLADYAKSLLEARAAAPGEVDLLPEPIEEHRE